MEYLVFLGAVILFLIILFIKGLIDSHRAKVAFREELHTKFGELKKKEYYPGKFDSLKGYFNKHQSEKALDDITWEDLGMDEVYKKLNFAYSSAGEEYIYYALRNPVTDEAELNKREKYITHFTEDEEDRVNLLFAIAALGFSGKYSIHDYIEHLDILGERKNLKHYLTWVLFVAGVIAIFVNMGIGFTVLALAICFNFITYFREKKETEPYITSFAYIMKLIDTAKEIEKLDHDVWNEEWEILRDNRKKMSGFTRGSFIVMSSARMSGSGSPLDMVFDYLRMMFHVDIIKFNNMLVEVRKHTEDLDEMIGAIGYLEMTIAAAAFRKSIGTYAVPTIGEKLSIAEGVHPLLENAVPNSITADKGVLLTGSNASGKSTFLKMVAVNAVLAQSVHTACAKSYEAPLFRIVSSMALKDNLLNNESYYIVEIKSIKRILDLTALKEPVLCFVDEVLRGTNTVERIAASTQILKRLSMEGAVCFAATHDVELADLLSDYYENRHFEEEIEDGDVRFSYKIMDGKALTRNAIKLLEVMGYEESLVKAAENMSINFLKNGVWDKVSYE